MQIRLLTMWRLFPVGHVFGGMPDGMANVLIKRGIAEVISNADQSDNIDDRANVLPSDASASQKAMRSRRR